MSERETVELGEASRRWRDEVEVIESELVALDEALGRVLREPLRARWPLPVHDHSAMDGYGVRAKDLRDATRATPRELELVGEAAPGHPHAAGISSGRAVRIFTGAPIPAQVDCVVRQEDVERDGERVRVFAAHGLGANIRRRGEDVEQGAALVEAGARIDPDIVMALASFGCDPVRVSRRPRVAIVTCGDELVPVAEATPEGVVDIAGPTIAACCRKLGAEPLRFGPAADRLDALRETLRAALASGPDLLITIGGASVGDHDLARPVLDGLGIRWKFGRVLIKPGKPTGFGVLDELPVFMLPGNPGAARVVFGELVGPALEQMQGLTAAPRRQAVLARALDRDPKRATVVQVRVHDVAGRLRVDEPQANSSARIGPSLRANASIVIPAGADALPAGSLVDVALRRPPRRRDATPILAFIGPSNSGKTTALCGLIESLSKDLKIGVIKHGRHFELDKPGKDSDRFRAAGAAVVTLGSPKLSATLEQRTDGPAGFAELLLRMPADLDLILVEGFKHEGLRSVEVHRDDHPILSRRPGFEHVVALVTNTPEAAPEGLPCYAHGDLTALEQLARALLPGPGRE